MEALLGFGLFFIMLWLAASFFAMIARFFNSLLEGRENQPPPLSERDRLFQELAKLDEGYTPPPVMGAFEMQLKRGFVGDAPDRMESREVQVRGLFPISRVTQTRFVVSIFDESSDGELIPVLSAAEEFQEPESIAYQCDRLAPDLKPGFGFSDWVTVGLILPDFLIPPTSGRRKLTVLLRMVDADARYPIHEGRSDPSCKPALIWSRYAHWEVFLKTRGYIESEEDQLRFRLLTVRLAIEVSMVDGVAHPKEAKVVRDWISRHLESYGPNRRETLKEKFNQEVETAFQAAEAGLVNVEAICDELNELDFQPLKYEAVELCYDVMAADGVAAPEEMMLLDSISDFLQLDKKKLEAIRDKRVTSLNIDAHSDESSSDILGIQPHWDAEQIKSHLRRQFTKWNNRLTVLPEGEKREQAQKMLDLIGRERRKYE